MKDDFDNLIEFTKQIKTGELHNSLQSKLLSYQKQKNKKKVNTIESIQEDISHKEEQIQKLLGEIIFLQNQLSKILDKELND
jgi:SMC interacting uncharacterized protein involved in chromosome segregation